MSQITKVQNKKKQQGIQPKSYSKLEIYNEDITHALTSYYREIIETIGEDPAREGLEKTPMRAAKSMQFLNQGYQMDPVAILKSAKFKEQYSEMVIVKDIEMYSMCEHHLLPFFGRAHIAYIPNGYIVGLSKLGRIVDAFSRRMQVQERLTHQILDCIQDTLNPDRKSVV